MILNGKTSIVTGASDGIGKEIAIKLAKEGVALALIARNEERLSEVKAECEKFGSPKVNYYVCDLSVKQEIKDSVGSLLKDFPNVDVLINNAGVWQKTGQLDEASIDDIEKVITTNLMAPVILTNLLLPELRKSNEAAIINVSSHSGIEAKAGQSVYCSSKWGMTGFTETLRVDLKGTNIRVAGIYQGRTATKLFEKAKDEMDISVATDPKDLAEVVVFMLSRPPKIWLHDIRVEY